MYEITKNRRQSRKFTKAHEAESLAVVLEESSIYGRTFHVEPICNQHGVAVRDRDSRHIGWIAR